MNSTGDIFALRGRRKYLLVSQIAHTVLYRLHSGACQTVCLSRLLKLGEVHTLGPRGFRKPSSRVEKFENLVPTCGFHYENLKLRESTGTLLLAVKESVH